MNNKLNQISAKMIEIKVLLLVANNPKTITKKMIVKKLVQG